MAAAAGIYWQSRMGNNGDGIGGNCHRYDIVTRNERGGLSQATLLVDYGIKIHNDDPVHRCSFPSPEGLFAPRDAPARHRPAEALLLTHCHEDHIGALRHAIDMGYRLPPIHCSAFTAQMVDKSLTRAGILDDSLRPPVHVVAPGETVRLANADVTFLPVDHLPGAAALLLRSKEATIFHSGDYKFDSSLPLGSRADLAILRQIGRQGVDMVISDSTAAGTREKKLSEAEIERNLTRLLADQRDRAVIAGLLGTQLDRLVSLGRAARANGRAVIVTGSSLCDNVKAAERAGLSLEKAIGAELLMAPDGRQITADRALVVTTGAFAQPQAGLTRAAEALPGALYVDAETTILIPQRAIPPVAAAHRAMIENFERLGARVITAENAASFGYGPLHQSGHAIAADTKLLYTLLKPKQTVAPMHGGPDQIAANGAIAAKLGITPLTLPRNGVRVRVNQQGAQPLEQEDLPRIGAAETGRVKQLPRAKPGEGRRPAPPPVYRYDRLDQQGGQIVAQDIAPYRGPTRLPARAGGRESGR